MLRLRPRPAGPLLHGDQHPEPHGQGCADVVEAHPAGSCRCRHRPRTEIQWTRESGRHPPAGPFRNHGRLLPHPGTDPGRQAPGRSAANHRNAGNRQHRGAKRHRRLHRDKWQRLIAVNRCNPNPAQAASVGQSANKRGGAGPRLAAASQAASAGALSPAPPLRSQPRRGTQATQPACPQEPSPVS